MSLPLGLDVSMGLPAGDKCNPAAGLLEPVVSIHDNEQGSPQPVELGDEHRLKLALLGVLKKPPASRSLM